MTQATRFKVHPYNTPDIVDWLMTNYGGAEHNQAWDFPQLPSINGQYFNPAIPYEDQLPLVTFTIHDSDLATLFKLTWASIIVS